jgi:multiple sugar transport system permease protein
LATIYRTAYFLPLVSSMVGSALIWRTSIYQPRFGLLNTAMFGVADALGLPPPPEIGWLTRPQWALTSVTIMTIWKFMGFRMVTFLAGLQDIPASLYEAAEIDGAGPLARLRHITIPLLAPTFAFVLVISTTGSLQIFAPMFIMTEGGPMYATLTVVYLMYQKAFEVLRFGYAASVSFILFGVILILTVTQTRLLRPRWEY